MSSRTRSTPTPSTASGKAPGCPTRHCGEDGTVQRQDFWRGDPIKVIGFQNDRDIQQVDLWWSDFVNAPEAAVGKYIVAVDDRGGMSTYGTTTVRDVTPFEYENAPWEDR